MDRFVLMLLVGLAMLSAFPPDWERDQRSAWAQVFAMTAGLFLISIYIFLR